jgi:hypothetical protein
VRIRIDRHTIKRKILKQTWLSSVIGVDLHECALDVVMW